MKILGINISHHSSSCLLEDGKIVYFLEDERLTRIKQNSPTPHFERSIQNGTFEPCFIEKLKSYTTHVDLIVFSSFGRVEADGSPFSDESIIYLYLKAFGKYGITYDQFRFDRYDHHVYHAAHGFYASGFDDAVCLILDGGGSPFKDTLTGDICSYVREMESIFEFSYDNPIEIHKKIYGVPAVGCADLLNDRNHVNVVFSPENSKLKITDTFSCGSLYNIVSTRVGLDSRDKFANAGKVMGLSQYYEDRDEKYYFEEEDWFIDVKGTRVTNKSLISKIASDEDELHISWFETGRSNKCANLSHKLQVETLKHTKYLIKESLSLSKSKNLVISGGYALNCLNNYQYLDELPNDVNVFIDPISNDAGTAIGAAKLHWYLLTGSKEKHPLTDLYLG